MTKKDYVLIANCINLTMLDNRNDKNTLHRIANELAIRLILDNPLFNKDKFYEACGLNR